MNATTSHAALITAALGTIVTAMDKASGQEARFKFVSLDSKMGKLKDGTKGEYVVLHREDDDTAVITLHPQAAQRLLATGEADGMKVVEAVGNAAAGVPEGDATPAPKAKKTPKVKAEKPAKAPKVKAAKEPKAPKVKAEKPAKEPKAPSKKALTIALVERMKGEGKTRAEIITAMQSELGLSQAGANTYYQNVKSGAWVATPAAESTGTTEATA